MSAAEDKQEYLNNLGANKMKEQYEFKVGDLVDWGSKKDCIIGAIDEYSACLKHTDGTLSIARLSDLKPHAPKQNWFGLEVDAFDTVKPERDQLYFYFSACSKDYYGADRYDGHIIDTNAFKVGIYTDEEKAKHNFKLMREHMIKEAQKGQE